MTDLKRTMAEPQATTDFPRGIRHRITGTVKTNDGTRITLTALSPHCDTREELDAWARGLAPILLAAWEPITALEAEENDTDD